MAGPPLPCLRCDDKKIPRGANGRLRRPSSGTTDTSGWRGQSTDSWKHDSCTFPCSGRDDAGGRNHRSFPGPTFGRRGRRASPGGPLLLGTGGLSPTPPYRTARLKGARGLPGRSLSGNVFGCRDAMCACVYMRVTSIEETETAHVRTQRCRCPTTHRTAPTTKNRRAHISVGPR